MSIDIILNVKEDTTANIAAQVGVTTKMIVWDTDLKAMKYLAASGTLYKFATLPLVVDSTTVTATGPTDDLDVSAVNVVFIDTSGNNVTIGGMTGGVSGQILHVVIIDPTNITTLEHAESTGNQDIYLNKLADEPMAANRYGGWTLVCNGTHWYEVDHNAVG
jgi:hypothetical protein